MTREAALYWIPRIECRESLHHTVIAGLVPPVARMSAAKSWLSAPYVAVIYWGYVSWRSLGEGAGDTLKR